MNDKQFLQLIEQDVGSKESPPTSATQNTTPEPQQNAGSTPPPATQNTTPEPLNSDQEFARLIEQDLRPDADKLQEAGEPSVMGAGDLPNPFAPQDATDTQRFNQAVASAEITGATPEEIQKQILVDYPNWRPIQRKVSQEEKDSGLWGTRWLTADTEYGFELPDGSVWSINKPGLSWGDIRGTTVQEVPYAIASALTGGGTMALRAIRTALAMGGVNVGQQLSNVAQGGRQFVDPVETALVAGVSGVTEPAFKAAGWGLRKVGQGLGYIAPVIPKATNRGRQAINNILTKNGKDPEVYVYTPEELSKLQEEAFERQLNRDILQTGILDKNLEDVMEGQTTNPYLKELTPEQFKKELKQETAGTATGFRHVGDISEIPLTSAEAVFDPTAGPTRQHQAESTKRVMDEEKRLAGVEGSLLEDTLDIRNERIAELLTQQEGLLSGKGKKESLEFLQKKLTGDINDIKDNVINIFKNKVLNTEEGGIKQNIIDAFNELGYDITSEQLDIPIDTKKLFTNAKIRQLGSDMDILNLLERGKTLQNDLAFTEQKLKGDMSPMTVEETAETIADSLTQYNDAWNDYIKWLYDEAEKSGQKVNMSVFEQDLIPYDIQLSNTPTIRKVYEQFIKMIKSDDTFTVMPDGTQKSATRPRTMAELELARRYLRNSISDLKKEGATFHEGEQLQKVYDKFLENIENLVKVDDAASNKRKEILGESLGELVDDYFDDAIAASEEFKAKQQMFGDKEFLTKVVQRIDKGETTPKQLLGMFLSATGEPKMGQAVIDKIKNEPALKGPVKDALLFNLLVEPSATGVSGKNLRLGQTLISRWNRIKNNTQVKELFGKKDWDELEKAMNKLTKVDVSRREGRINSATADRMLKGLTDTISNATITGKILNKIFSNIESGFEDIANQKGIQKVLVEMADEHNRPIVVRGKPSPLRNVASTGAVLETNEEETK